MGYSTRLKMVKTIFILYKVLKYFKIDFLLTIKVATLILISRRGSAISSAKERKSVSIYNLANS